MIRTYRDELERRYETKLNGKRAYIAVDSEARGSHHIKIQIGKGWKVSHSEVKRETVQKHGREKFEYA